MKTEKQIDLATGVLPTDRYDASGNIKRHAVPDVFLEGQTFSNQSADAPFKCNMVIDHEMKKTHELLDIQYEKELQRQQDQRQAELKKK